MIFSAGREVPQGPVAKSRQVHGAAPCLCWLNQRFFESLCAVIRNLLHRHIQGSLILMPSNNAHPSVARKGTFPVVTVQTSPHFSGRLRRAVTRQAAAYTTDDLPEQHVLGEFAKAAPISILSRRTLP
jgi:hypothetical protein